MVDQAGNVTVNYLYNAVGQLAGLTDGSDNPIVTYTYNNLGELTEAVDGASGGPYTTYQYDADGDLLRPDQLRRRTARSTAASITPTTRWAKMTTMTTLDGTWTYSYDADGQLVHAVIRLDEYVDSQPGSDLRVQRRRRPHRKRSSTA